MPASGFTVRPYSPTDEASWLRCRLLGFFDTDYYDDVWTARPPLECPSVQLVAVAANDDVIGLLDVEIDDHLATIDSVAVHPDSRRLGIATTLLDHAVAGLPETVSTLDAWTREDASSNAWYQRHGFVAEQHYLHVYKSWDEPSDGFATPEGLSAPVTAFVHASIEEEDRMRAQFRRVYVCRRYVRALR